MFYILSKIIWERFLKFFFGQREKDSRCCAHEVSNLQIENFALVVLYCGRDQMGIILVFFQAVKEEDYIDGNFEKSFFKILDAQKIFSHKP